MLGCGKFEFIITKIFRPIFLQEKTSRRTERESCSLNLTVLCCKIRNEVEKMTRLEEMLSKRAALIEQMQSHIDADRLDDAEQKKKEIEIINAKISTTPKAPTKPSTSPIIEKIESESASGKYPVD